MNVTRGVFLDVLDEFGGLVADAVEVVIEGGVGDELVGCSIAFSKFVGE